MTVGTDTLTPGGFATDPLGDPNTTNALPPIGGDLPVPGSTALDEKARQDQAAADLAQAQALAGTTTTDAGLPIPTGNSAGAKIIRAAEHYIGTPYKWGGTGPGGVDCSGLVQLAYRAAGINLPRISYQQANAGMRVGLRGLRPGDLVAWDNSSRNNGADHIAIFLGWIGGHPRIIEAAHPGTAVRYRVLGSNEGAFGVRMGW